MAEAADTGRSAKSVAALAIPLFVGIDIAVAVGVYAKVHHPAGTALNVAGFSSALAAKTWLTSFAFGFAIIQLASAQVMYGRIPLKIKGISAIHRWSGRIAVLITVPVAINCLYALGFQDYSGRVLIHSLLGCLFYGIFATKMLLLSRPNAPSWAVQAAGGLLFTALTGLWLSAALWFFTNVGVKL
jgi:hypothetical protein